MSQMVYSSRFLTNKVVELMRVADVNKIKNIAPELRNECKQLDFGLQDSLCKSEDIKLAMKNYQDHRPKKWLELFQNVFPNTVSTKTEEWLIKFDTVFQIIYYWINHGTITPLHCSLAETVHNLSQCRQLLDIMNRMGLCMSYDSMKRIDATIA